MQQAPFLAAGIAPAEAEPPKLIKPHPGVADSQAQPAFSKTFRRRKRDRRITLCLPDFPGCMHLPQTPKLVDQGVLTTERLPAQLIVLEVLFAQIQWFCDPKTIHGAPSVVTRWKRLDQGVPRSLSQFCLAKFLEAEPKPEQPSRFQRWWQRSRTWSWKSEGAG